MKMKRVLSVGLVGAMALSTLALTGCGSNSSDGGRQHGILVDYHDRRQWGLLMMIMRTTRR